MIPTSYGVSTSQRPSTPIVIHRLPGWLLIGVLVLSLMPLAASLGTGFDIGIADLFYAALEDDINSIYNSASTLLALISWTAVTFAFTGFLLSLSNYNLNNDATAPLVGIALAAATGCESFYTLISTGILANHIQFTDISNTAWITGRIISFSALLACGLVILISTNKNIRLTPKSYLALGLSIIVIESIFATLAINMLSNKQIIPIQWVSILDAMLLALIVICAGIFYRIHQIKNTIFTATMALSFVPAILSEIYLQYFSETIYDHYFISAHILKIIMYSTPLTGLLIEARNWLISDTINRDNLTTLNKELNESEERIKSINNLIPAGLLVINSHGIIESSNEKANKIFEYGVNELNGKNIESIIPANVINEKTAADDNDFFKYGITKDQLSVPIDINTGPIYLDRQLFTLMTITDTSERKKLIDDLQEKNRLMDIAINNLTHSNEQLERFAYICSHDLQEPVRMVQSFTQLLAKRLDDKLDNKEQEYIHYIVDGAERARNMISDILQFCRLDQPIHSREMVSLSRICHEVNDTLKECMHDRHARFHWDEPLPSLNGVKTQIFQLFLNIVSNGIKFNKSDVPEVHVSYKETPEMYQIFITDNGIGINEKYQKKVFNIFERLNSRDEFSGTGIGLATCLKIAQQHSGSIDIDSEEGKGATFVINWPKLTEDKE